MATRATKHAALRIPAEDVAERWKVLQDWNGNKTKASIKLGISRYELENTLRYKEREWPNGMDQPSATEMRSQAIRGQVGGPPIPDIAVPPEGFVIKRNSAAYDAEGKLTQQWIESGQGNTDGWEIPAGHVVKGESAYLDANGNLIGRWIKTREGAGEGFVEALKEAFAAFDGVAPQPRTPDACDDDTLTVYPVPDLHLGMVSWGQETGADYDMKIATSMATETLGELVKQSRPSRHAVVLILGDFFHANDQKNVTPGSGHQLDMDSRFPKIYLAGAKLAIALVDMVAAKHDQVELIVLPGNHDPEAAVTLAIALSLFYSRIDRIDVNITPGVTWYRRFGQNLLGANHGHTLRTAERMAMAMAVDAHEDWGQTTHRFIWTGHLHHEVMKEVAGVRVETLGSPAARDAWNAASGYRSNRSLQGITVHRDHGEIGRHRVNISGAAGKRPAPLSEGNDG